jgi:hypothetical protein
LSGDYGGRDIEIITLLDRVEMNDMAIYSACEN